MGFRFHLGHLEELEGRSLEDLKKRTCERFRSLRRMKFTWEISAEAKRLGIMATVS